MNLSIYYFFVKKKIKFSLATGATALIGLGGATYSLNHGTQKSKLTPWVTNRFTFLVFESDTDARSARIVRIMQEEVMIYINLNNGIME